MKIIHFSDIHTGGRLSSLKSLFNKSVIGTLNYKLRRQKHVHWERLEKAIEVIKQEKPDLVINTGDITSVSDPKEFQEASQRLKALVEDTSFQFINVPGNHDNYIENKECLENRDLTYSYLNRQKFELKTFPLRIELEKINLILVDESRPNSGTISSGLIKAEDIDKIKNWTQGNQLKPTILIGHYPLLNKLGQPLPERRCLENSEALLEMLENRKIDVTLCGHIHAAFARKHDIGSIEVCAGSLTIGGKLNKLEYNQSTGNFSQSWIDLK
jgi:3',5'-cyclic AMP phosphodiesterase CpdA